MSDTPRTDKAENDWLESWDRSTGQSQMASVARQLERELNEAKIAASLHGNAALDLEAELNEAKLELSRLNCVFSDVRESLCDALPDSNVSCIEMVALLVAQRNDAIGMSGFGDAVASKAISRASKAEIERDSLRAINAELEEAFQRLIYAVGEGWFSNGEWNRNELEDANKALTKSKESRKD